MVDWSDWECRNTDLYSWLEIISLAVPEMSLGELKGLNLEKIIYFKAFSDTFTKILFMEYIMLIEMLYCKYSTRDLY